MNSLGPPPASSPSRFRRTALGVIVFVLALAAAAMIYENISEARDRRFNAMPGRLVDVGGHKMHIDCTGEGTPAVILDSGLGDTYTSWRNVQPQVTKFTQVCSYDRAGLGYSDPSSQLRTSKVFAEELHALLHAAGIAPPYVLVGHSMAGFDVRLYVSLYRSDVAGVVLVDASHPDQSNRFPAEMKNMEGTWQREADFMEYTMPFGVPRQLGLCDSDPVERAAECNLHSAREAAEEMRYFPESAAQAAAAGSLGDLPLAVLSHDPDKPSTDLPPEVAKSANDAWDKMQEDLAHLSTRGTRTIANNSSHYIQIDRPDVVIDAIHKIVDEVRAPQSAPSSRL